MSFLSGARPAGPTGGVNTDKIDMAITECVLLFLVHFSITRLWIRLDTITDFFNRMVASVILFEFY